MWEIFNQGVKVCFYMWICMFCFGIDNVGYFVGDFVYVDFLLEEVVEFEIDEIDCCVKVVGCMLVGCKGFFCV